MYVFTNAKSQVILILKANWRQFTVHTSLLISCDIFKKKCNIDILMIFWKWHDNCITINRQTIFWGLVITAKRRIDTLVLLFIFLIRATIKLRFLTAPHWSHNSWKSILKRSTNNHLCSWSIDRSWRNTDVSLKKEN